MRKKIFQRVLASGMAVMMLLTGLEPAMAERVYAGIGANYDHALCEEVACEDHLRDAFEVVEGDAYSEGGVCVEHCHLDADHEVFAKTGISVAILDAGITEFDVVKSVSFVADETIDNKHGNNMAEVLIEKAPEVNIFDVRVLDDNGEGNYSDVSKGIRWAVDNGADVIAMSFAGYKASDILSDALAYAEENNVLVIAAAGNDGTDEATYPSAYVTVVSVGVKNENGMPDKNFNYGETVDVFVENCDGTSEATQCVVAMAVRYMQEQPDLLMDEVRCLLAPARDKNFNPLSGAEEGKVYVACNHVMGSSSWKVTKEATCTSDGKKEGRCIKCGTLLSTSTITKLGHSWGSWSTTKSATCTASGSKKRTCSRCKVSETQTVAALGHISNGVIRRVDATCTKAGYTAYICSRSSCGAEFQKTTIAALNHSYVAATCTSAKKCSRCGVTSGSALGHNYAAANCTSAKKCSRCGGTSGSALGHSYTAATCTSAKKCSRCGVTSGSALGHSYAAATCTSAKKCSRCGVTSGSALGHSYAAATCTSAKKCSRCGVTSGSALGHSYAAATCTSAKKCSRCGVTSGSALGHSYAAATCTSAKKCSRCGVTSGSALGHNYTDATCTSAKKCTRCGTTSGTALGHTSNGVMKTVNPTCAKEGYRVYICSRTNCGAEFNKTVLAKTTNHDWKLSSVQKASTCTEKGTSVYKCSVCGGTESRTTEALEHNDTTKITEATCTVAGKRVISCTRCGRVASTETIAPLGHYSNGVTQVTKQPTCTATGTRVTICSRTSCGAQFNPVTLEKLGHSYGAWSETKAATCTTTGSKKRTCTRANCASCETATIDVLGHTSNGVMKTVNPTCAEEGYKAYICSRTSCGAEFNKTVLAKTTNHDWKLSSVQKASTCTEKGTSVYKCSVCGGTESRTTDELGHNDTTKTTEATCTVAGKRVISCTRCKRVASTETIAALGHYSNGVTQVTKQPTCTATGTRVMICSRTSCGAQFSPVTLEALGHNYGTWSETKAATCTTTGSKVRTCTRTNCTAYETGIIEPLGHTSNGVMNRVSATCTEDGYTAYICSRTNCGAEFHKQAIEATGHNYTEATCTSARTCTKCGVTSGDVISHSYADATCTMAKKCTKCGTTLGVALGHDWNPWEVTKDANCIVEGSKKRTCNREDCAAYEIIKFTAPDEHDKTPATCTLPQTCTRCEKTFGEALGHNYESTTGTTVKKCTRCGATCGTVGHDYADATCTLPQMCTRCDASSGVALGHDWNEWEIIMEATCKREGTRKRTCGREDCTAFEKETYTAWDNHNKSEEWVIAKDATCMATGLLEQRCKRCGEAVNSKPIMRDSSAHKYGQEVVTKQPTSTEEGKSVKTCLLCGDEETTTLEKIVFNVKDEGFGSFDFMGDGSINPGYSHTLVSDGSLCLMVTSSIEWELIAVDENGAIADYVNMSADSGKNVTYVYIRLDALTPDGNGTRSGKLVFTCGGETRVFPISQGCDHVYGDYVVTQEPTPEKVGIETAKCKKCGNPLEREMEVSIVLYDGGNDSLYFRANGDADKWSVPSVLYSEETGGICLRVSADEKWVLAMEDRSVFLVNGKEVQEYVGMPGNTEIVIKLPSILGKDIISNLSNKLIFKCAGKTKEYIVGQAMYFVNGVAYNYHKDSIELSTLYKDLCDAGRIDAVQWMQGRVMTDGVKIVLLNEGANSNVKLYGAINTYEYSPCEYMVEYMRFTITYNPTYIGENQKVVLQFNITENKGMYIQSGDSMITVVSSDGKAELDHLVTKYNSSDKSYEIQASWIDFGLAGAGILLDKLADTNIPIIIVLSEGFDMVSGAGKKVFQWLVDDSNEYEYASGAGVPEYGFAVAPKEGNKMVDKEDDIYMEINSTKMITTYMEFDIISYGNGKVGQFSERLGQ